MPFNLTVALARMVGRGMLPANATDAVMSAPKAETMLPGATAELGAKLAPFTTPFGKILGSNVSFEIKPAGQGNTKGPETQLPPEKEAWKGRTTGKSFELVDPAT